LARIPRTTSFSDLPSDIVEHLAVASNRSVSLGKYWPFRTPLNYFTFISNPHPDPICNRQLYPEYPKEVLLFYSLLRKRAAPTLATATVPAAGFFLKHVDDKGLKD
ncbi:hypothetical protein EDB80DRAFT_563010, partial [Ilyonectria destructans]